MKPLFLSLITSIILPFLADAMPTAEEIAAVKPLVAELMKPDMDAMKLGRKSKVDVAKSAMQLIAQADTPAAKMLLARGAFQNFVKGGDYDAAEKALDALLKAVPDYPADEQQELLEKALYPLPLKKAPQLRARLADIRQKASSAVQVRKIKAMLEKSPDDPALHLRLATAYALQDDWPNAVAAFAKSSDAALVQAAKAELDSSHPPAKTADLWWSVELPKSSARLSSAIRAHAAALYTRALPTLTGLAKVQAERRIAEVESAAEAASTKSDSASSAAIPSAGSAKFTGVKLVGSTVKNTKGVLSDFSGASYALIESDFSPGNAPIEAVMDFTMAKDPAETSGILSGIGQKDGFTPFLVTKGSLVAFLSNSGTAWDIASFLVVGVSLKQGVNYRCKCEWTGSEYVWSIWHGKWVVTKRIQNKLPIAGGLKLAIGSNRGTVSPFNGTIDLNRCYIKVDGKLWWEGEKGAYKNANK